MLKVYIPKQANSDVLDPYRGILGMSDRGTNIFGEDDIWLGYKLPVEIVENPAWADYICIPHSWAHIIHEHDYIAQIAKIAREHSKTIIVFSIGDSNDRVSFPRGISLIVIRNSQFRDARLPYEIIMPAFSQDLKKVCSVYGITDSEILDKPTITFCGWSRSKNIYSALSISLKNIFWVCVGFFIQDYSARRPGLCVREQGLRVLEKSKLINSKIIRRTSYTGNKKTIQGNPNFLRKEYIESLVQGQYVYAPRGDGNFSVRFFEALSLGRIPVVPDTGILFPLEEGIEYSNFVIKIPLKRLKRIDEIIFEWHKNKGVNGLREACLKARQAFDQYLNVRVFCNHVFTREYLERIPKIEQ